MPEHTSFRLSPNLAWLLLPLAWFGPFMPGSIEYEGKSLLVTGSALALFFYIIRQNWGKPSRHASIFQPGDIYYLFNRVRLLNPVQIKSGINILKQLRWPQARTTKVSGDLSLSMPGLFWFAVLGLLIISLLIP